MMSCCNSGSFSFYCWNLSFSLWWIVIIAVYYLTLRFNYFIANKSSTQWIFIIFKSIQMLLFCFIFFLFGTNHFIFCLQSERINKLWTFWLKSGFLGGLKIEAWELLKLIFFLNSWIYQFVAQHVKFNSWLLSIIILVILSLSVSKCIHTNLKYNWELKKVIHRLCF